MAIEYPAYGQLRVSNELKKTGVLVSPGGVSVNTGRKMIQIFNMHQLKIDTVS